MYDLHCDYCALFSHQKGSGLPIYQGLPHQRGYGVFTNLFKRFGVPLLKYLGKKAFIAGKNIGEDIIVNNADPKHALKTHLKQSAKTVGFDALSEASKRLAQVGSGRRLRRRKQPKRKVKRTATKRRRTVKKQSIKKLTKKAKSRKRSRSTRRRHPDIFGY